jgi:hypothetical protein
MFDGASRMRNVFLSLMLLAAMVGASGCSATSKITVAPQDSTKGYLDEVELARAFDAFKSMAKTRRYCLRGNWFSDQHTAYEAWPSGKDDPRLKCDSDGTKFTVSITTPDKSKPSADYLEVRTALLATYRSMFASWRVTADWEDKPGANSPGQASAKGGL